MEHDEKRNEKYSNKGITQKFKKFFKKLDLKNATFRVQLVISEKGNMEILVPFIDSVFSKGFLCTADE